MNLPGVKTADLWLTELDNGNSWVRNIQAIQAQAFAVGVQQGMSEKSFEPGVNAMRLPACDHDECSDPRFCRYWSQVNIYLAGHAIGFKRGEFARDAKKGEK